MAYGTKATFDEIRQITAPLTSDYQEVGSPLTDHARMIRIVNELNAELFISLDGFTDQIRMAPNSFFILDFSSNKVHNDGLFLPVGTQFFTKLVSGSPLSGTLWIEVVSAKGGV